MTDKCPYACWFCHNEGTGARDSDHVPDLLWSADLEVFLATARQRLGVTEVHLTGGEPTAHPDLAGMVVRFKEAGLHVKMTSIGMSIPVLDKLIGAGIDGINFSMHSLDADEFLSTQLRGTRSWATSRLRILAEAILHARDAGIAIKLNTVVTCARDLSRVRSVLAWADANSIPARLLSEVTSSSSSLPAITELCASMNAVELSRQYTLGSSSYTVQCSSSEGHKFGIKLIRSNYLEGTMCAGCLLRADGRCGEKFYGVRLEPELILGQQMLFSRLCLHRSDAHTRMPAASFFLSPQCYELVGQQ